MGVQRLIFGHGCIVYGVEKLSYDIQSLGSLAPFVRMRQYKGVEAGKLDPGV